MLFSVWGYLLAYFTTLGFTGKHETATRLVSLAHAMRMTWLTLPLVLAHGLGPLSDLSSLEALSEHHDFSLPIEAFLVYLFSDTLSNLFGRGVLKVSVPWLTVFGHHGMVGLILWISLSHPVVQYLLVVGCLQELSTVFYHLHHFTQQTVIGLLFVISFGVLRILFMPWMLLQITAQIPVLMDHPESVVFATLLYLGWLQTLLNGYWFVQIVDRVLGR